MKRAVRIRLFALAAALALLAVVASCGGEGEGTASPSPATDNLFQNPGLEEGRAPWYSLKPPDFILSEDFAHSGKYSALLRMRDPLEVSGKAGIYYLVQEVVAPEFPEVISGFYRVENWKRGTEKQYLQFVVIVFGATNMPAQYPNHQIRYLLAGIDKEPFAINNAFFVFIDKEEPKTGQWVRFERNLREDFQRLWGAVPENFDYIRFLFEVRWDDKNLEDPGPRQGTCIDGVNNDPSQDDLTDAADPDCAGEGPAEADVYYDDLYLGPASGE